MNPSRPTKTYGRTQRVWTRSVTRSPTRRLHHRSGTRVNRTRNPNFNVQHQPRQPPSDPILPHIPYLVVSQKTALPSVPTSQATSTGIYFHLGPTLHVLTRAHRHNHNASGPLSAPRSIPFGKSKRPALPQRPCFKLLIL